MILSKQQLTKLSKKYHLNTIYLFGSQATGKTTPLSDYDFAVLLDESVNKDDYSDYRIKLMVEFQRMLDVDRADVIILNQEGISNLLQYNVVHDGKVLFCKKKSQRVDFEVDVLKMWMDWRYFENSWGEMYINNLASGKYDSKI